MELATIGWLFVIGVACMAGLFVICALAATHDLNNGSNGR